ncbi:hypothetical protein [Spiroplasma endosymbiont of Aspidapion aeneum]|uniref:hypothetical protein n=1 Tax=Spiroplasma endosymbiont of Aspidapion aeneum TaxID=3066276 RepID=UPI00313BA710
MIESKNICIYCIKKIDAKEIYISKDVEFPFHKRCYMIYLERTDATVFIIFSISFFIAIIAIVVLLELTFF